MVLNVLENHKIKVALFVLKITSIDGIDAANSNSIIAVKLGQCQRIVELQIDDSLSSNVN